MIVSTDHVGDIQFRDANVVGTIVVVDEPQREDRWNAKLDIYVDVCDPVLLFLLYNVVLLRI